MMESETEMPIEQYELELSIRQHYHELEEAHNAGFINGRNPENQMTIEQSWEQFIGDYGKREVANYRIFDSQLRELCAALGWQGGTYHLVLEEIKRLKQSQFTRMDQVSATLQDLARVTGWTDMNAMVYKGTFVNGYFSNMVQIMYGTFAEDPQFPCTRKEYLNHLASSIVAQADNRVESHC